MAFALMLWFNGSSWVTFRDHLVSFSILAFALAKACFTVKGLPIRFAYSPQWHAQPYGVRTVQPPMTLVLFFFTVESARVGSGLLWGVVLICTLPGGYSN
jgi:hypothetical protein